MTESQAPPVWLRLVDIVIVLSALAITVVGALVLFSPRNGDAYATAPACAHTADAFHEACYAYVGVTATAFETRPSRLREPQPEITVASPELPHSPLTLNMIQPPSSFYDLEHGRRGNTAFLKVWNGFPTAVFANRDGHDTSLYMSGAIRTDASPYWQDDINIWGGWALLGVGLTVLLVHPVWWLLPVSSRKRLERFRFHWTDQAQGPRGLFANVQLRVAVVALVGLNLLDIATSLIGARHYLFEANPVAEVMVESWGPLGGFFSLKLPALIAILLALSKLPVRVALLVAWAACGIMIWVVVNNLVLAWNSAGPV